MPNTHTVISAQPNRRAKHEIRCGGRKGEKSKEGTEEKWSGEHSPGTEHSALLGMLGFCLV